MLRGELTGLRAPTETDIEIFETELLTDVETRIRATGRPWLPVAPGAADSPYRQAQDPDAVVRVLCHYGFAIRGLHRLQITTLADNHAMIGAAVRAGFVLEGTTRDAAWIDGGFADGVTLSQLSGEWSRPAR